MIQEMCHFSMFCLRCPTKYEGFQLEGGEKCDDGFLSGPGD